MDVPNSPSVLRNQRPIFDVLSPVISHKHNVFELGSGTAQHAHFFASSGYQNWQCSELPENLHFTDYWITDAGLRPAVAIDMNYDPSGGEFQNLGAHFGLYDAFFTANTLHIMPEDCVPRVFEWADRLCRKESVLFIYGPFNYDGKFTSESNAAFELWLKERDPRSGIRDFEAIVKWAKEHHFELEMDHEMPANNRILQFRKKS